MLRGSLRIPALVLGGAMLVLSPGAPAAGAAQTPPASLNHAAPGFSRTALDGSTVRLSAYRGKVILLNFWASWCGPCLLEIPRFSAWQRQYQTQGLQVIGVSMDDSEPPARAVTRKYAVPYPVVMGDEKLGELYGGILGLPVSFLIDRKGVIRFRHQGVTDLKGLQAEIERLLRAP